MREHSTQNGSIAFNVLMAILLVTIGVLSYMLIAGRGNRASVRVIGTPSDGNVAIPAPRAPTDDFSAPVANDAADFDDGLGRAGTSTAYPLDEFGAGTAARDVFFADINRDGAPDRITRTTVNSGTAHTSIQYTIEIATDTGYLDITPSDFNTVEGADCALRKIRITLTPRFHVVRISRPLGDTWDAPTIPIKEIFSISNNQIVRTGALELAPTCDVAELF